MTNATGKQFYCLFSFIINVKQVPWITPTWLDNDRNLHSAMLMILGYIAGVSKGHLQEYEQDDHNWAGKWGDSPSQTMKRDYNSALDFTGSPIMEALISKSAPESAKNKARQECLHFFKWMNKPD